MKDQQKNKLNDFLALFESAVKEMNKKVQANPSEHRQLMIEDALLRLLLHGNQRGNLPVVDSFYEFHKAFRQMDCFESGELDMVCWLLLHASDLFWEVAAKFEMKDQGPEVIR